MSFSLSSSKSPIASWFNGRDGVEGNDDGGAVAVASDNIGNATQSIMVIDDSTTTHGAEIFLDHLVSQSLQRKRRVVHLCFGSGNRRSSSSRPCLLGRLDERTLVVRRLLAKIVVCKDDFPSTLELLKEALKVKALLAASSGAGGASLKPLVVIEGLHMVSLFGIAAGEEVLIAMLKDILDLINTEGNSVVFSFKSPIAEETSLLKAFLCYQAGVLLSFIPLPSGISQSSYGKLRIKKDDHYSDGDGDGDNSSFFTEYVWSVGKEGVLGSSNSGANSTTAAEDVILINRVL